MLKIKYTQRFLDKRFSIFFVNLDISYVFAHIIHRYYSPKYSVFNNC